ncbi:PIN domain-containing protein [Candidatus Daviesbacteria bacterium]|nr:PIN domain-containing protein [Candidatus Daviesbacteria bacterium]
MTFVDASAYLAAIRSSDPNHRQALNILQIITTTHEPMVTSWAILGEVLTVTSMRFSRQAGIQTIEKIMADPNTKILLESQELTSRALNIFKTIPNKNVSWVDCYSFAIINQFKIDKIFSFDNDFKKHTQVELWQKI